MEIWRLNNKAKQLAELTEPGKFDSEKVKAILKEFHTCYDQWEQYDTIDSTQDETE